MPETNLWGVFAFPIGRIYTNVSVFYSYLALADEVSGCLRLLC